MVLEYNLQFFAKEGMGGERTEPATPKKLEKARNEGQTDKSTDLNTAVMLLVLFFTLRIFGGYMLDRILTMFTFFYNLLADYATEEFTIKRAMGLFSEGLIEILLTILPILAFGVVAAFLSNKFQIKWKVTFKPMKPKFSKLNPITGFKRFFSKDRLMDLAQSILKLVILFYFVYDGVKDQWGIITNIYELDLWSAITLIVETILDISTMIGVAFLVLAFLDRFYHKWKFKNDMKMSKQEIKEEFKNAEGNPQVKAKIRRKMQEASRRRMMQKLPEADVVITNPTHLAVALKYDKAEAEAPVVIAKGADYVAEKIKEVARSHRIEIVEDKPLARMLYYNVEIGDQIPPELYQMVAEILAYVYGLQGKVS